MEQSLIIAVSISFGAVFLLLANGIWVFACLGMAGIIAAYFLLNSMAMVPFIPFSAANSWTLTAIPFFVFIGAIISYSGLFGRVYSATSIFLRRLPGNLLHTNIVASGLFGSVTGSAAAAAATIGTVAFPELEKRGYDMRIGTATAAFGGLIGSLIPPSTVFIIYGAMTEQSIGKLFFAGLIPGIIIMLLFMGVILIWKLVNPAIAPSVPKITERNS